MNDLYAVVDGEIRNQTIKNNIKTINSSIWVILIMFWSFPSSHSMLRTSALSPFQSRSLPVFYSSSWNFNTLDGNDLLESSIINIQIIIIIINFMMEYKILMVVPSCRASSLFKYRRILSKVAFLTSWEYSPMFLKSLIRFPGSTSLLQNLPCCWSVLWSVKCFKHLVQKYFFSAWLWISHKNYKNRTCQIVNAKYFVGSAKSREKCFIQAYRPSQKRRLISSG